MAASSALSIVSATVWVRFPGAASGFAPWVRFWCRLSYGVRTAGLCSQRHQHLCARYKIPNNGSNIPLFGHRKIQHTFIGIGSAAFAAAVALPRYGKPNYPQEIKFFFFFFFKGGGDREAELAFAPNNVD